MDRLTTNTKGGLAPLKILIGVLAAFSVFFLLQLLSTYLLMRISHFENYYGIANILVSVLTALTISLFSGREKGISLARAALSSFSFSLISLCVGLVTSNNGFSPFWVLLRYLIVIGLSILFTALFNYKKKRVPKNKKFRF